MHKLRKLFPLVGAILALALVSCGSDSDDGSETVTPQKTAGNISYATTSVSKTTADEAFTNTLTKTGDGTVTYASSKTDVAEVNTQTGLVTIKGAGEATITATVADSDTYTYATKTASYTITVTAAASTVAVTGLSLDKTTAQTVAVGNSISFTATVAPDNATDKTVKWSVSGTGVTLYSDSACSTAITTDTATSTLTVYAKGTAAGNATVTVTSNADSTKTASCAMHVKEPATGHALSASEVGEVVGIDGLAYAVTDKDNLPTGVSAAGMVAYKNGTNGLVIALTDEANQMNYSTANGASGAAAHMPTVTGYSWKQTSVDEFKQMFEANGGSQTDCSGLNTVIGNAGGTGLNGAYWTSTWISGEVSPYIMEAYSPVRFRTTASTWTNRVRACLEF